MPLSAVIKTARLTLRPLQASDETDVVTGIGDWEVVRWLSVVPHPYGTENFHAFLAVAAPGKVWAIEAGDGFVGVIGMDEDLGYWLVAHAQGRGYATEAARAVLAAHFADPAAGLVRSGYFDGNARSGNVLTKLGFRTDGFRRLCPVARPAEQVLLRSVALTRADWLNETAGMKPDL
jgi:RimJ/RimL family protein N-acetyltransferase